MLAWGTASASPTPPGSRKTGTSAPGTLPRFTLTKSSTTASSSSSRRWASSLTTCAPFVTCSSGASCWLRTHTLPSGGTYVTLTPNASFRRLYIPCLPCAPGLSPVSLVTLILKSSFGQPTQPNGRTPFLHFYFYEFVWVHGGGKRHLAPDSSSSSYPPPPPPPTQPCVDTCHKLEGGHTSSHHRGRCPSAVLSCSARSSSCSASSWSTGATSTCTLAGKSQVMVVSCPTDLHITTCLIDKKFTKKL